MTTDYRERFAALAAGPDNEIQLDEAALLIAAEAEYGVDVDARLAQLDQFAARFQEDSHYRTDLGIPVAGLISYIHEDLGFSGNVTDYYDPRNSYLDHVMDTRHGIPISLALIHLAIGRRLDIPVEGISFPGHFLIRYGQGSPIIVDPFSGRELSRADCQNLLRQIAGPRANLIEDYFEPAAPRDILIRVLDNLKQIFWRSKSWDESKACIERQLLLLPDQKEFNVQLGAVYEMQGNMMMAQHAYIQVLEATEDDQLKKLVSKRLLALESASKTIH